MAESENLRISHQELLYMEHQQVTVYQKALLQRKNAMCPSDTCEDVRRAKARQVKQINK